MLPDQYEVLFLSTDADIEDEAAKRRAAGETDEVDELEAFVRERREFGEEGLRDVFGLLVELEIISVAELAAVTRAAKLTPAQLLAVARRLGKSAEGAQMVDSFKTKVERARLN